MLGADQVNGQNQVAWKKGSSTYWVTEHDENWNASSGAYYTLGTTGFQNLEVAFAQDLNSDNIIGFNASIP